MEKEKFNISSSIRSGLVKIQVRKKFINKQRSDRDIEELTKDLMFDLICHEIRQEAKSNSIEYRSIEVESLVEKKISMAEGMIRALDPPLLGKAIGLKDLYEEGKQTFRKRL